MKYVLGVDGGGSKTTVLLCDETGKALAETVGGGVNYNSIGLSQAKKNLKDAVDCAIAESGAEPDAAFLGLAALSSRADEETTRSFCEGVLPCKNVQMDSDVFIALETLEAPCAAIAVCGTGSMAAARLPDGTVIHAGGWGYLLGDEASGYALSLDGVRAALRAYEGVCAPTLLTEAARAFFNVSDLSGLIGVFYDPPIPRSAVAAFAPAFFDCVNAGDETAAHIASVHAALFAQTVKKLLLRLPESAPLGLWGGIFEHQEGFRRLFLSQLEKEFPRLLSGLLPAPPVRGAVKAAMRLL